jgi:hypothetical protein
MERQAACKSATSIPWFAVAGLDEPDYVSVKRRDPGLAIVEALWDPA